MVTAIEPKGIYEVGRQNGHRSLAMTFESADGHTYAARLVIREIYVEGLVKAVRRMVPVKVRPPADPGRGEFEVTTA